VVHQDAFQVCKTWHVAVRAFPIISAITFLMSFAAIPSSGAENGLVGDWTGRGQREVTASIRPDPDVSGQFTAKVEIASAACLGDVEVSGELGTVVVAKAKPPYQGGEVCRIEFRLVGPNQLRIRELDNCTFFHGVSCGFGGELERRGPIVPLPNAASSGDGLSLAAIQQLLNDAGFNAGRADGKMGRKTRRAIRQYQAVNGLMVSGRVDAELIASLRAQDATSTSAADATAVHDLEVPVIEQGGDGQVANCFSSTVLRPPQNSSEALAVRTGPGGQYSRIDELRPGEVVSVFDVRGDWGGIVYRTSHVRCSSRKTHAVPYKNKGWVNMKYLKDLAG